MIRTSIRSRHTKVWFLMLAFVLALLLIGLYASSPRALPPPPQDALYLDAAAPIESRIDDLLSHMTLAEKVGQMVLVEKNSVEKMDDISRYGLGGLLSGFGGKPDDNTKEGWRAMVMGFVEESKASRLGIPILYGADAIHGHSNVPGATVFPHAISFGAAGDAQLVRDSAAATARELRATGVNWNFAPNLDLPRDIRWGRTYETFTDDPALAGRLGTAAIEGLHDPDGDASGIAVLATPKHYLGAGGMLWGHSSNLRFTIDQGMTPADDAALRAEYLPPFIEAVEAGALSIMAGLNSWGDTKLAAERHLLTDVLKEELGFNGFIVSDWYGVYEIPGSDRDAAVAAINAGIDMIMLPYAYLPFIEDVVEATEDGAIPEARIDDAVRRILRAKFALGLFDTEAELLALDTVGASEHRTLARDAVARSLVLLKNEASTLPLPHDGQHIRVAGSAAHNIGRQSGAWTVEWQGIDGNWLPGATSILDGIRARAGKNARIEYDLRGDFSRTDEKADIGIAIVGETPYAEGWGDTAYPILGSEDRDAIRKLQETCVKVVVVIISGRPLFIAHEVDSWDALVAAWLPGSEGAGIADVLFGDKPFQGRLPLPWPHHAEQLPVDLDGGTTDGTPLLFPRYFGLRYGRM